MHRLLQDQKITQCIFIKLKCSRKKNCLDVLSVWRLSAWFLTLACINSNLISHCSWQLANETILHDYFIFFQDLVLCQPTSCYYLFQYLLVNLSFSVMKPQLSAEVVFGGNIPSKNTFSIFKTSCWLFYCMWKFLQMKIYQIRQNIDVKSCGTIFSNPVFCQCILIIQ